MNVFFKKAIEKLNATGFFHIFGATLVNKILGFLSNFIIVRLISKTAFGEYTYANNILSFILILSGLGLVSGVFQLCSENIGNIDVAEKIYAFGNRMGVLINIILAFIIVGIALIWKMPIQNAGHLLALMSITPLVNILFEFQQIYLRYHLKNKAYSYASTFNTALLLICSCIGAYIGQAEGLIFSRYIAYILSSVISFKVFKAPIKLVGVKLERGIRSVLLRLSVISMLNNGLSQMLYLLDIFVMGLVGIGEIAIASYKVATIIPTALYFIPSAICIYIYPHFAMNKDNKEWLVQNYKRLTIAMVVFNAGLSLLLIVLAPFIISLFFGKQYLDAVVCFRILMIGYFFNGSFRGIAGNLLVTQRRLKFNLFEGLLSGGVNVLGNLWLIPLFGSIGAAYATLIVMTFSATLSTGYFIYVLYRKEAPKE